MRIEAEARDAKEVGGVEPWRAVYACAYMYVRKKRGVGANANASTNTQKKRGGGEGEGGETEVGDGREREMWKPEDCERGFTTTETTQVEKLTEKEKGESNRTEGQQIRGSRTCAAAFACLLLPRPRRVRS